jgi:hypothetical protein
MYLDPQDFELMILIIHLILSIDSKLSCRLKEIRRSAGFLGVFPYNILPENYWGNECTSTMYPTKNIISKTRHIILCVF